LNFSAIGADSSIWLRNQWLITGNTVRKYNNISKDQGTYNYIGFDTNGCKYETSKPIFMYAAPKLFYDSLVCVNASVQFEFVPKIKDFYYTKPNNTNKLYASGSQMFIPFSKSADSGIYKFYITDLHNCYDTISANLDVKGLPKIKIIPNKSKIYCLDDFLQFDVSLNEKSNLIWRGPNMKSTNSSSLYKFGLTTQDEGTYWVRATNNFGCVDSMQYSIIVKPKPIVKFTADQFGGCGYKSENYVVFKDFSTNVRSRKLYVDTTLELNNTPFANVYRNPGTYSFKVVLEDNFGCKDSFTQQVIIFPKPYCEIPNAFTPNNDDLNRYYKPVTTPEVEKYDMKIFNRWGQKIFEYIGDVSADPSIGSWDGTYKTCSSCDSENAPEGVYVVLLKYKAKCEIGYSSFIYTDFTLLR
jgi:gliding motility-associated-like protein